MRRLIAGVLVAIVAAGLGGSAAVAQDGTNRTVVCTLSFDWTYAAGVSGSGSCLGSGMAGIVPVVLQDVDSRPGIGGCPLYLQFNLLGIPYPEQVQWWPGQNPLGFLRSGSTAPALVSGPLRYPGTPAEVTYRGQALLLGTETCGSGAPSMHGQMVLELNPFSA